MPGSRPVEQTSIFTMKKLKKLFSFKSKRRKRKSNKEVPVTVKIPKRRFRKLFNIVIKFLEEKYPEQIKALRKFVLIVMGYGLLINYALYFIFQFRFDLFSFFAWGIVYYFVTDEFTQWFRRLIAKR